VLRAAISYEHFEKMSALKNIRADPGSARSGSLNAKLAAVAAHALAREGAEITGSRCQTFRCRSMTATCRQVRRAGTRSI
jgi:hypothetical protein